MRWRQQRLLEKQQLLCLLRDEFREKAIRIRKWTHEELRKIGDMGNDLNDVMTRLLKERKDKRN